MTAKLSELQKQIWKLRQQGKDGTEIARIANEKGFKTRNGTPLTKQLIYNHISQILKKLNLQDESGPKTKKRNKTSSPEVLTFAEPEVKSSGKVMVMVTDVEDARSLFAEFLR